MAKKKTSQGTPAVVALQRAGVAHTVHAYDHEHGHEPEGGRTGKERPHYGQAAAQALGVPPERLFKTLLAQVDDELAVAVVPVSASLDLKAFAAALGGKRAQLAEPAVAEKATGYVVGGISPLGQRRRLRTVVDASAKNHPTVYVSAGRRGLQVELAPADLVEQCAATSAPIATAPIAT
ncbi:Cys-tRNA(Pro) deacylase [Actinopolymorpha cephalotaxi]|uniref:Cys-tRNA(Pro)/Cys-tRNA(Cys) deacylase n=1 Tax=Actinopolymorpha cephalotaxi TaxID=504797 RepID=A0ABX2RZB5_9ACTN|nr:Cys-tRNA(Pro)/Cys-tRNA(Cys) deacylase [Actinopolymorpha cephalotaxi]